MKLLTTILHPHDFTALSHIALRRAVTLAQEHHARLIVLHVAEPPEAIEGEFGMPPPEPQPSDEALLRELERMLPANPSFTAECRVARGIVADEIVRTATEVGADLIVMATHGPRNFFTRLFHANIAEQVADNVPCSVMLVHASDAPVEEPAFLE